MFTAEHLSQTREIKDVWGNQKTLKCECEHTAENSWTCFVHGLTSQCQKIWRII